METLQNIVIITQKNGLFSVGNFSCNTIHLFSELSFSNWFVETNCFYKCIEYEAIAIISNHRNTENKTKTSQNRETNTTLAATSGVFASTNRAFASTNRALTSTNRALASTNRAFVATYGAFASTNGALASTKSAFASTNGAHFSRFSIHNNIKLALKNTRWLRAQF